MCNFAEVYTRRRLASSAPTDSDASSDDRHWSPFNFGRRGMGVEALALLLHGCVQFIWMSSLLGGGWWFHEKIVLGLCEPKVDDDEEPVDADVQKEAKLVQRLCLERCVLIAVILAWRGVLPLRAQVDHSTCKPVPVPGASSPSPSLW